MDTYLKMLGESLDKKLAILSQIYQIDLSELEMLKQHNFNMVSFDESVDNKLKLMGQIDKLDEGFEAVYDRIRQQMLEHKNIRPKTLAVTQEMHEEYKETFENARIFVVTL